MSSPSTTAENTTVDVVNAPADYDAFYRQYKSYVEAMCRKLGIEPQNVEDVAADILVRMFERDILAMFDPTTKIEHRGQAYAPRFKSFVTAHVSVYCQGKRDKQNKNAAREPLLCDRQVTENGPSWVEVFGPTYVNDHGAFEEHELVTRLRTHLITVPRRSAQDRCDLPALFDAMLVQVQQDGRYSIPQLMSDFGVSNTAIHNWIRRLRDVCAPVLARHLAVAP